MEATTIKIHQDTKLELDKFREYRNESYDEVIRKVIYIAKECDKELSKDTIKAIERARERMKQGKYVTAEELKRRLGL
jgi:predicted transcriptional regulator